MALAIGYFRKQLQNIWILSGQPGVLLLHIIDLCTLSKAKTSPKRDKLVFQNLPQYILPLVHFIFCFNMTTHPLLTPAIKSHLTLSLWVAFPRWQISPHPSHISQQLGTLKEQEDSFRCLIQGNGDLFFQHTPLLPFKVTYPLLIHASECFPDWNTKREDPSVMEKSSILHYAWMQPLATWCPPTRASGNCSPKYLEGSRLVKTVLTHSREMWGSCWLQRRPKKRCCGFLTQ